MPGMIANALVPIFFGLSIGYLAGWRGIVDNKNVTGLNTFLLSYALPAALFLATAQTPRQMLSYHAKLFGILALSMILTFVVVLLIELKVFKFSPADSAAITLTLALPNWVAVGLPLFLGLYGPQGSAPVAVAIVCGNLVAAPMSLLLLEAGGVHSHSAGTLRRFALSLWRTLMKPVVLGPILGVGVSLAGYALAARLDPLLRLLLANRRWCSPVCHRVDTFPRVRLAGRKRLRRISALADCSTPAGLWPCVCSEVSDPGGT